MFVFQSWPLFDHWVGGETRQITDIIIPQHIAEALSAQAVAERNAVAKIILAKVYSSSDVEIYVHEAGSCAYEVDGEGRGLPTCTLGVKGRAGHHAGCM